MDWLWSLSKALSGTESHGRNARSLVVHSPIGALPALPQHRWEINVISARAKEGSERTVAWMGAEGRGEAEMDSLR